MLGSAERLAQVFRSAVHARGHGARSARAHYPARVLVRGLQNAMSSFHSETLVQFTGLDPRYCHSRCRWLGRCCDRYEVTRRTAEFRIVVATDESSQARAALATVLAVPWPAESHVRAVIARQPRAPYSRSILLSALDQSADEGAARARRTLARRWPSAEAVVVDRSAVEGILQEADRFRADLIAVGWRGHGTARRLLMGSVSRGVVRGAKCAVLVVRQRPRRVRRIVIGFDASQMLSGP